jgi:hypothetical protein
LGVLFFLLCSTAALIVWLRHRPAASARSSPPLATSKPSTRPATLAVAAGKRSLQPATAPAVQAANPSLVSKAPHAAVAPVILPPPLPTYTPASAPVGFIGFERVELKGHFHVDSYDASTETYAPENAHGAALLLSNGPIQLGDSGDVQGDVRSANGSVVETTHHRHVSGQTSPLHHRLRALPIALDPYAHDSSNGRLPAGFFKNGNLHLHNAEHLSLPPGVYYLNDVTIDAPATLHLQGATTLLISGRLNVTGTIETPASRPANCHIRVTGRQPVSITHDNTLYLDLYAPASDIDISGKGDVYGSVVGKTLRVSGKRPLHFDESLLPR